MVGAFLTQDSLCFDVRSPIEYEQGHIPGAINLPLFSNEEREKVGTLYKKRGQKEAVELGIKIVGPKLFDMLQLVKEHLSCSEHNSKIRVYCFRGGMRSGFVNWFFNFVGIPTTSLPGGYKAFRRYVLSLFECSLQLQLLGGFTGTGKTLLLYQLKSYGEQIIDLENIAQHRGSSFGLIPNGVQPTTEQFENELAMCLERLDHAKPIWVEDESRQIGFCTIPNSFYAQMRKSPLLFLETAMQERIDAIVDLYGAYPKEYLALCCQKIAKRLGSERYKDVLQFIENNRLDQAVRDLFYYYDKAYLYALKKQKGPVKTMSKGSVYDTIREGRVSSLFEEVSNLFPRLP